MADIKQSNFFSICYWMIDKLKLKNTELSLFAIIYGFTQHDESYTCCSFAYFQKFTNSSRSGVIASLNSLVDKGYIIKISNENRVNSYRYNSDVVDYFIPDSPKFGLGSPKIRPPRPKIRPNNIYNNIYDNINNNILTPSEKKTETLTEHKEELAIACEPIGFVASNNDGTVTISDYKECYDEVLSVMDKVTDKHIDNSIKDNINNTEKELPNEQENYSISPQQTKKQKVKQKKTTEQTRFTIEKYPYDDYYKKIALLINENRGRFSPIKFITEKFICGVDNMLELVSEQDYETALINMFDKDSYVQYPNYSPDLYTYIFDKDKIIYFLEIDFNAERERKENKLMFDKYVSLFKETFQYSYSTKDNYHNATQLFFALSREQMECAILNIPEVFKRESIEPKIDEYLYKELYIIPETVVKEEIIEEEIILIDENELDI